MSGYNQIHGQTSSLIDGPIETAAELALFYNWDSDRINDNTISIYISGDWSQYSINIEWDGVDSVLKLIAVYEMDILKKRIQALNEAINEINYYCWTGFFTFDHEQKLMLWKYGLATEEDWFIDTDCLDNIIQTAIANCEKFYPCFQTVGWSDSNIDEAIQFAMPKSYGRA